MRLASAPRKIGPAGRSPMARSTVAGGAGCEGDGDGLGALAVHNQGAVPALLAEVVDIRAEGFGDA
jgi:hypothetical protein